MGLSSYYYAAETKLYYLQSRYYDPAVGRFINADRYASTGQGFVGFNMFAYCGNNAVCYSDRSGARHIHIAVSLYENSTPTPYIPDQEDESIANMNFGVTTVAHGGCGVVASYNALVTLENPKDFEDVLDYYNNRMAFTPGHGLIGLNPSAVVRYFRDLGYNVFMTDSPDLIDLYSKTADASILYYVFPATYGKIKAYGAHFVEYHWSEEKYVGYNTAESNGVFSFLYPSDYGYSGVRYYAIGIFISERGDIQ